MQGNYKVKNGDGETIAGPYETAAAAQQALERLERAAIVDGVDDHLTGVTGVGETKAEALRAAGFATVGDLQAALVDELTQAQGIGAALAGDIKDDVGADPLGRLDRVADVDELHVFPGGGS